MNSIRRSTHRAGVRLAGAALFLALGLHGLPAQAQSSDAAPTEHTLFSGAEDKAYFSFRIPALLAFESPADGAHVVLAFAEARKQCGRDSGDIDTVVRISRDGGRSWGRRRAVAGRRVPGQPDQPDRGTWGNPTATFDRATGKVWLMMNHNRVGTAQFPCHNICGKKRARRCKADKLERGIGPGDRRVFVTWSDDEGRTWAPRDITSTVQSPKRKWDAVGPGNGIALSGRCGAGTLMFPAIGRNIFSTDQGQTWTRSRALPGGTSESTLVELSDGTLLRNDRPATKAMAALERRPVSHSEDCGQTWSKWAPHPELPTKRVHASMIRLTSVPGDVLVFSNPASTERRKQMTLRVSPDGGQSWPGKHLVHGGIAAYSSLAEITDGSLGLLYEKGKNNYKSKGSIADSIQQGGSLLERLLIQRLQEELPHSRC